MEPRYSVTRYCGNFATKSILGNVRFFSFFIFVNLTSIQRHIYYVNFATTLILIRAEIRFFLYISTSIQRQSDKWKTGPASAFEKKHKTIRSVTYHCLVPYKIPRRAIDLQIITAIQLQQFQNNHGTGSLGCQFCFESVISLDIFYLDC